MTADTTATTPLTGAGRREWTGLAVLALLLIGASAFAVVSVAAAYAPNPPLLIVARALPGVAARLASGAGGRSGRTRRGSGQPTARSRLVDPGEHQARP
ncbi:hypothetical protein [Micromonospora sp. IBHARD004]|uniref:hypothetical protein n=1 Tax=Micromonospora sp. IBHARD004 TaxID=3457764 RepID=UPI00405900D7